MMLEIKDLYAKIGDKEVLKGLNLNIKNGEIHALMGPNGSGKSTLAKAVFGHPNVKISSGDILIDGRSILDMPVNKRAGLGIFLGFQIPVEMDGVRFMSLIKASRDSLAVNADVRTAVEEIKKSVEELKISEEIMKGYVNKGISGGEKKKTEILQMLLQKPKIAILDEPDSGLDIDAVKIVASSINKAVKNNHMGLLLITHYNKIFSHIAPEYIHIMIKGKIVAEGGSELIEKLENGGFEKFG